MTCRVVEASGLPVNALGEVVVALGIGTDEVVGTLPPNSFPIDNKRLSLRLPPAVLAGNMRTEIYDSDEDGKIAYENLSGVEPTLTKGNLVGTTNQVSVSGGTNAVIGSGVTLSLPQDLRTQSPTAGYTIHAARLQIAGTKTI